MVKKSLVFTSLILVLTFLVGCKSSSVLTTGEKFSNESKIYYSDQNDFVVSMGYPVGVTLNEIIIEAGHIGDDKYWFTIENRELMSGYYKINRTKIEKVKSSEAVRIIDEGEYTIMDLLNGEDYTSLPKVVFIRKIDKKIYSVIVKLKYLTEYSTGLVFQIFEDEKELELTNKGNDTLKIFKLPFPTLPLPIIE